MPLLLIQGKNQMALKKLSLDTDSWGSPVKDKSTGQPSKPYLLYPHLSPSTPQKFLFFFKVLLLNMNTQKKVYQTFEKLFIMETETKTPIMHITQCTHIQIHTHKYTHTNSENKNENFRKQYVLKK